MATTKVTVEIPSELSTWLNKKVQQKQLANRTHAVVLALVTLKRIFEDRRELLDWVYEES